MTASTPARFEDQSIGPTHASSRSRAVARQPSSDAAIARILALQRTGGNAAVTTWLRSSAGATRGRGASAQRLPVTGESVPQLNLLTGDPVPGYEQLRLRYDEKDVKEFWNQLHKREKENKENAAKFIGGFGGAMVSLWGRHVGQVMAEAGKSAGWALFDKVLSFVAIKGLETIAATLLTPGSVAVFEAFGKELTHQVAEIGIHAISGYAGERVAEALQDNTKEDQIDAAEEDIDKVTAIISTKLETITIESINAMPDVTPYAEWLSEADKSNSWTQLSNFRLPPLFPSVDQRDIWGSVAGVITGVLDLAGSPWPAGGIIHHDSYITVDGPGIDKAEFHSPFKDLRWEAAAVPISSLPTVPLRITIPFSVAESIGQTAARLMGLLRPSGVATAAEIDQFIKASDEIDIGPGGTGYLLFVERSASGDISVSSGSLGQYLFLYQWATSDWGLAGIASPILDLVPDKILGGNSSRMATPVELMAATQKYLLGPIALEGARTLIEKHVNKLFPSSGPL